MALSALWQTDALGENIDRMTEFVDVSMFYKLRVCGHSDTLTDIHLDWSTDGVEKALTTAIKIGSGMWRSEEQKVLFPFVRLHIINSSGKPNCALRISVHSFGHDPIKAQMKAMELPPALVAAQCTPRAMSLTPAPQESEPQVRFKIDTAESDTPDDPPKKRTWFQKKLSSPKHTCRDDRLPGFLPFNSILTTDKKGNIIPIAPGNHGDILTMTMNGPAWISPATRNGTFEDTEFDH